MAGDPTVNHSSHSRAGSRFGPYLLKRLLGSGGFGEVYEAEDTVMHRVVALKLLSSSYSHNPAFRERLFREARTAGRLHDPHVVPIHGCGEIDGQLYIDMRLVDGTDLQTILDHGSLGPERSVAVVRQIAAALDAAHSETVIHRDVKPANILLGRDDFACLVDFGLANAATDTKLTSEGTTIGSFAYLAPERLASGQVTPAADIYALACVLYECLTGSTPYEDRSEIPALVAAHLASPAPRPSQQLAGIPVGFDEVIARGMAKNPQDRYRTAGELGAAAQRALNTPVPSWAPQQAPTTQPWTQPRPPAPRPLQPKSRRRRNVVTVGVIALVATIAATIGIVVLIQEPPAPARRATPTTSTTPTATAAPSTSAAPPLNATRLPVLGGYGELGGLAVSTAGDIYVVDSGGPRLFKLAANSNAPIEVPIHGLVKPKAVAVDSTGNVYVCDWNSDSNGRVLKVASGSADPVVLPFGQILPSAVAVDAAGSVYIASRDRVLQLGVGAPAPNVLPLGSGLFESVTVDTASNVYAVQLGRVLKLAPGAATPSQLPFSQLNFARGIAVDTRGTVYVVDNASGMGRLLRLPDGATTSTLVAAPENQTFGGVAVDSAGTVYVTENNRLLRIGAG